MKNTFLFLSLLLAISTQAQLPKEIMYTGTYSVRGSEGIYVYEFTRSKGTFEQVQALKTLEGPGFLAVHPSGKFLYSVNGGAMPGQQKPGSVSAYAIDQSTGKLSLINHQSSYGTGPCHVTTDHSGKLIFVSNYREGNLTVFPVRGDGSVGTISDSIRFTGSSANKQRQEKAHVHSATVSPDNRFVLVADLGSDKVYSFAIDLANGKLNPAKKPFVEVKPGSGPRHLTFDPKGNFVYLAEELTSSVASFSYNKETGALALLQDLVASLPADFTGANTSADIHTDAAGKYLFMSNRGHQSLAIYAIDRDGKVAFKYSEPTQGEKPRNFLVDPKNEYVFAAHQDTDNIVVFKWDAKKGKLTSTGTQIKVPSPICLKMLQLK
jgi:6-phosphogluconolactonase